MNISQKGIDLIKQFEGCRLTAYSDAKGIPTIGYGHTKGVSLGMTISQAQAENFLKEDVKTAERAVSSISKSWNQNHFDALVSFTYNCGSNNLQTLCKNRTIPAIGEALLFYNKCGEKVLDGLTKRRHVEQDLYFTPITSFECLTYTAHSADYGWGKVVFQGKTAGIKDKGLECLQVSANGYTFAMQVHVQDIGWMDELSGTNILTAGTTGKSLPIEAIRLFCQTRAFVYRVHTKGGSWGSWVWNGEMAGTTGKTKAIDQIEIKFAQ